MKTEGGGSPAFFIIIVVLVLVLDLIPHVPLFFTQRRRARRDFPQDD